MIKFKKLILSMLFFLGGSTAFAQFGLPNSPAALPSGSVRSTPSSITPVYTGRSHQNYSRPAYYQHNQERQSNNQERRSNREHRHYRNNNFQNVYYFYPYGYIPTYTNYVIDGSPDNDSYTSYTTSTPQQNYPGNIQTGVGTNQIWVDAQNGNIPDNAIIFQVEANGNKTYYCQAQYKNANYQGVLVLNDACYVQDQNVSMRFTQYQVLVQSR